MWLIFFVVAIVWVFLLLFYVTMEMNGIDKNMEQLGDALKKHYESQ